MKRHTQPWTAHEEAVLRAEYPFADLDALAARLNRGRVSVLRKAENMNLKRSFEVRAAQARIAGALGARQRKLNRMAREASV